jgi:uncharacterized membrane protein
MLGPVMSAAPVYMDAVIRPNRSLSPRGFRVLVAVVAAACLACAAVFMSVGVFWAPVFASTPLIAVLLAFRASFAAGRLTERVRVTARDIRVTHEAPGGARLVWESPTAFTRVEVETDETRVVGVKLRLSRREASVAQALSPRERGEFAQALKTAIREARAERG